MQVDCKYNISILFSSVITSNFSVLVAHSGLCRGYTGHEHLPWFGLVNMNQRLYDPVLGRFLAPDPIVQNPENSQNYNKYSYALNNPLKYVDITGMSYWYSDGKGNWSWHSTDQGDSYTDGDGTEWTKDDDDDGLNTLIDMFGDGDGSSGGGSGGGIGSGGDIGGSGGGGSGAGAVGSSGGNASGSINTAQLIDKFNQFLKGYHSIADPATYIANYFTKEEIAWLSKQGKILLILGWANVLTDAGLALNTINKGQPWGWHAFNAINGAVGMFPPIGPMASISADSYVSVGQYIANLVSWLNNTFQYNFTNYYFKLYK